MTTGEITELLAFVKYKTKKLNINIAVILYSNWLVFSSRVQVDEHFSGQQNNRLKAVDNEYKDQQTHHHLTQQVYPD